MVKIRKELWWVVLGLAALCVGFTPDTPAANAHLVAQIGEPFEVAGAVYPAGGELSLRTVGDLSPVVTLHEIRVDGRSLGLLMARTRVDAVASRRDELIFKRATNGRLLLDSVAFAGEPLQVLHGFPAEHVTVPLRAAEAADTLLLVYARQERCDR
jgi:hypothetical protein